LTDEAIEVKLSASHPSGSDWTLIDRFRLKPVGVEARKSDTTSEAKSGSPVPADGAALLADALAGGMASRLVRISLARGPRQHGKETFRIKIINDSPLILNGLAVGGNAASAGSAPSILQGLSLPP